MATLDDTSMRLAAFEHVRRSLDGDGLIRSAQLEQPVTVGGRSINIWVSGRGIFCPKGHDSAITLTTTPPTRGVARPYNDDFDFDLGLLTYKYEGTDPDHWANVRLRQAYRARAPVIYLYGVSAGYYAPSVARIVGDSPNDLAVTLELTGFDDPSQWLHLDIAYPRLHAGYRSSQTWERLQRTSFRHVVLSAYGGACTLCGLSQRPLLEAAHIIPRAPHVSPTVTNGLAMCNLHRKAYDRNILGVNGDHRVAVRRDVRAATSGPILTHDLKRFHGTRIRPPKAEDHAPDPDALEERYEQFKAAPSA